MRKEQADEIINKALSECKEILTAGRAEYAGEDVLKNFKSCGLDLELPPEVVCFVYLKKHIDGIATYVRTGKKQRDSISGRITDAINYLILLQLIFTEKNTEHN